VRTGRLGPASAARRTAELSGAITGLPVVDGARSMQAYAPPIDSPPGI
jgi:hypothetical protein